MSVVAGFSNEEQKKTWVFESDKKNIDEQLDDLLNNIAKVKKDVNDFLTLELGKLQPVDTQSKNTDTKIEDEIEESEEDDDEDVNEGVDNKRKQNSEKKNKKKKSKDTEMKDETITPKSTKKQKV